jgi:inhibitor of KinA
MTIHMVELHPLGDQAVLAYLPDEETASRFAAAVRAAMRPGWLDVVQAYSSVAVHFDSDRCRLLTVIDELRSIEPLAPSATKSVRHEIPCCYELGPDLERVAKHVGLGVDAVVRLHCEVDYRVYAIGFCPGFPYLGYLAPQLAGVPRLSSPRKRVEPGSVGLTGRQTGIYPLERPGGWNLVGRTPLMLVNVADGYFPMRVGDRVRFRAIPVAEFHELRGRRLPLRKM